MGKKSKGVIGIAGNALVGKDTLCEAIIEEFKIFDIVAARRSIAGDRVRADLKDLIWDKFKIDATNPTNEQKTLIRPIMVEYGRIQRIITNGRYFIEKFVQSSNIDIVPDIRYAEYDKDELYWIKEEMDGFLIYLERDGVLPANIYEEKNNSIIRDKADLVIAVPTYRSDVLKTEIIKWGKLAVLEWFAENPTISQLGIVPPLDRF